MKIVLATGIYPPQIGGPATYVKQLSKELSKTHDVTVVTYGEAEDSTVVTVSKSFPVLRWYAYASALRKVAKDADVVYAFSSISCGVPLIISGLKKPKKVLRLGGDFFWERYTDRGGRKSLREWYQSKSIAKTIMGWVLNQFDHIVFSTEFQQQIYRRFYKDLPDHSVVENALPHSGEYPRQHHSARVPFRLLFMGRFVAFKNIPELINALTLLPDCYLTLVGEGPQDDLLRAAVHRSGVESRIQFVAPLSGKEKFDVFASHDLLVLPSLTEISPNTALEACSVGLPVLLSQEHGLSADLSEGMQVSDLHSSASIAKAINAVRNSYGEVASSAVAQIPERSYAHIASESLSIFDTLCLK